MMDIVFGQWADAGAWPDHAGDGEGAIGAPVVGPLGLLEILETALGLGSPAVPEVVRVAAFQSTLEHLAGQPRFWTRSLEVDGWATARTLLRWRDELVDSGWRTGTAWSSGRLADLTAASEAATSLPHGLADRVAAISEELESSPQLPIHRIRLIDRRELHSSGWRTLLERVEACGVAVEEVPCFPAAPEGTALGRLQRWMLSGGPIAGDADGTVTIARSASAALAAEVSGSWFAEREDRETVLIAQDSDTQLLDHGLAAAGQPRGGRSRNSPHRGSLQILLLAFKIAWAPFDPRALLELLLFPTSPIARRAGHRLAALLEEAPGRGGTKWENAWSDILSEELAEAEGDSALIRKAHARVERWRTWAEPALVDPVLGLPIEEALAACDRTISWAGARYASEKQPLYRATMTLASDVRGALVALGRERLPRNLIERIVDQVLDAGHDNPNVQPEAATWRSVAHPGAIWGPVDAVVWWNFGATREGLQRQPWTAAEKAELLASGCTIDPPDLQSRAASAAWERAVINARSHLLFVASGLDSNEGDADHPLSHRLAPATGPLATKIRLEEALSSPTMILAGVELRRSLTERAELPARRTVWSTPAGYADRARDLVHSATSFESGLACQLMWALKHVARLRPGRSRSIPDANQLLGNLAHALANLIFFPGAPPSPEDAAERTRELLDVLITEMAAPLRLPEFAAQLADATERLPLAMAELARTLHANGLVVEASEKQVSASFAYALAVRGAVDLIARDRNGEHVVIDLKWTRNPKRRLDELKDGEAVQLATYGAMVAGEAGYKAGYFLLNQRQFATLERGGLIGRAVEGACGFSDTWTAVRTSWRLLGKAAAEGTLVACGAEDASDHLPQDMPIILEANCGWCDYQTLCRVRGLK